MTFQASTLGQFVADLMAKYDLSNRSLAAMAGVSESAIRNLLKFGIEPKAKDPDARTLTSVAKALDVDAIRLFRLAGYIPPEPSAHSPRADYIASAFDELPAAKQDAVIGVLEAMIEKPNRQVAIREMRENPSDPLAGLDLNFSQMARLIANQLIAQYQMTEPSDVENIMPEAEVLQYTWGELPQSTRERVKALIRHKLSLNYDPTMVDPEWRE
jgi:transcriptional regulator with XRE-family HTH domain